LGAGGDFLFRIMKRKDDFYDDEEDESYEGMEEG
jgi:hypothetical protein